MDHFSSNPVQKKKTKHFNQVFPAEIVSDILSRLPTESVLDCKLVCTTWKNLIQQPSFPKMHLARLNRPDSGKLRYVFMDTDDDVDTQLFYFEYNENEDWNYVKPIPRKFNTGTIKLDAHVLIGSFNGLVCVYGTQNSYDSYDAMIINPVTKEYIALPVFDSNIEEYERRENSIGYEHLACGFGYLAETNEYKVVRIYRKLGGGYMAPEPNVVEVDVYTVGSGKGWRHVGKFDLGIRFVIDCEDEDGFEQLQGVFLNGCLHWRNVKGGMVMVFDLATEKFRDHIPPPPMLTDTYDDEDEDGNMVLRGSGGGILVLGVSGGGILYYAVHQFIQEEEEGEEEVEVFNDVWLLMRKDDNHVLRGHEEKQPWVWSKDISLEQTEPFTFKKQDIVLRYDQGNIKEFVSCGSTWTDIWEFSEISHRVFPHKHTLISLKELGEEDAKIMKRLELTMDDYHKFWDFDSDSSG